MISINHVLTGTAIGLAVKNPLLVAPLAFLSHFVLDAVPHYNYQGATTGSRLWWRIWCIDAVGSFLAIALTALAAPELALAIMVGGVCAELPDVFWIYEQWIIRRRSTHWFYRIHRIIQWSESNRGLYLELVYMAILVSLNIALLNY